MTILNADGLYLTSYRVLHLNIKLRMEGHYHRPEDERYPSISGITDNKGEPRGWYYLKNFIPH